MRESLELTESERMTLQELSENHPYPDFRCRALGVLALTKGHQPPLVAEILGVTPQTVYNWAKAWRMLSLMSHQGTPVKLTSELMDAAERITPCTLAEIARQLREILLITMQNLPGNRGNQH
jgi:transposase